MDIYLYENCKFTPKKYKELFSCDWEQGEELETFLDKAGFYSCADVFGGFLSVRPKRESDGFYVSVDLGGSEREFYVGDFIELVNLLKFFGLNYFQEMANININKRILTHDDLQEDFANYQTVVPLGNESVYVTSYEPILNLRERRALWEERRKKNMENKSKNKAV